MEPGTFLTKMISNASIYRLNMVSDLQSLFGLQPPCHVMYLSQQYSLPLAETRNPPPIPPRLDSYTLLVSQDRRYLFMTPCFLTTGIPPWPKQSAKPWKTLVKTLPLSACGGAQAGKWRRDASPGCRRWWSPAHCSQRYGAPCSRHSINRHYWRPTLRNTYFTQCCGSRSGLKYFFDHWIWDRCFSNPIFLRVYRQFFG